MATNDTVATHIRVRQLQKNDFVGLHTPTGLFAKRPWIGLLMFIFGGLVFGALLYDLLAQGPLLVWDRAIANTLPAIGLQNPTILKPIMDSGYYLGGPGVIILGFLISIFLIIKRYWQELTMLVIGTVGSSMVFWAISNLVGRTRPATQIWVILKVPGFPSGHTLTAVAFFGILAYFLIPTIHSTLGKFLVAAASILIMLWIGFTRVFTGGHYLTDVLAGYAVGIAWSGVAYTLIEIFFQKIRSRNVKKE